LIVLKEISLRKEAGDLFIDKYKNGFKKTNFPTELYLDDEQFYSFYLYFKIVMPVPLCVKHCLNMLKKETTQSCVTQE
jgi:hypothetical protein